MALGRQRDRQGELMVTWAEMPRPPGHVFYDRLQGVLVAADFDAFAEALCAPYYAPLRAGDGGTVDPAGSVLPDALGRLFSRASTPSAGSSGAVPTACRCVSSCASARAGRCRITPAGSLLAEQNPQPAAARGARAAVHLGAGAPCRAGPGQRRADRR